MNAKVAVRARAADPAGAALPAYVTRLPIRGALFQASGARILRVPAEIADAGGVVHYLPALNGFGGAYDAFEVAARDPDEGSFHDAKTIPVTVTPDYALSLAEADAAVTDASAAVNPDSSDADALFFADGRSYTVSLWTKLASSAGARRRELLQSES
eukprot:3015801-Pyramimonas_sp.AAC.1